MTIDCKMAAAAVVGSSHAARNEPCQDCAAVLRGPEVCAIALADGAGSARRARAGALSVVGGTLRLLGAELAALLALDPSDAAVRIIASLQRDLARQAALRGVAVGELAATLLFVASDGARFLCGQLGDGRVAKLTADLRSATPVFTPHKGEFFNQTAFVTDRDAAASLMLATGSVEALGGFALLSDGADESLYQRAQGVFAPALSRMVGWLSTHSEREVQRALRSNLRNALRERTGDDLSLALLRLGGG